MKLARHDHKKQQTKIWVNIINQSKHSCQSELYEEEKKHMFIFINNFVTQMVVDKDRLNDSRNNIIIMFELHSIIIFFHNGVSIRLGLSESFLNDKIDDLRERMKSAYGIINQLKHLINMENSCFSSTNNVDKDKSSNNSNNGLLFFRYLTIERVEIILNAKT